MFARKDTLKRLNVSIKSPIKDRIKALSDAFMALAARFPDDETQIFSAIYLTATQLPTDKSYATTLKAAGILEAQFAKHPDHPGIAHYLIHAYDYAAIAALCPMVEIGGRPRDRVDARLRLG